MRGDALPLEHHVLRHCRKGDLKEQDGVIRGIFPDAFEADDDGISVTWIEYFAGTPGEQLSAARTAMGHGRTLRESHRLAKLNVKTIVEAGRSIKRELSVIHDPIEQPPEEKNLGHSLIKGVASDDDDLRNRLANIVTASDLAPAKI